MSKLLDELTEQFGPPDESMVAEAMAELTALVHRLRLRRLPVVDVDLARQHD
ncbi:MAG: hypothetical protein ACRDTA_05225 [Pseudonocardiaceae bacterium]